MIGDFDEFKTLAICMIGFVVFFLFGTIGIWVLRTMGDVAAENSPEGTEGYVIYLDGQEVDADKVDISMYEIRIDHENETIYATGKTERTSGGVIPVPIYIP